MAFTAATGSLPPLLPYRLDVHRHLVRAARFPLRREPPPIPEQRAPRPVGDAHLDPEARLPLVEPLAHIRHAGEDHREPEPDGPFVEPLVPGPQAKAALRVDRQID